MFTLLQDHWFELIQTIAIVAGFLYTARTFSLETRVRKTEFIFLVNRAYREIWDSLDQNPQLARILDRSPDLDKQPITQAEERLILLVIHHLSAVHEAMTLGLYPMWSGIEEDIRQIFRLPIPRALLREFLPAQRPAFQSYLRRVLRI